MNRKVNLALLIIAGLGNLALGVQALVVPPGRFITMPAPLSFIGAFSLLFLAWKTYEKIRSSKE